MNPTLMFNRLEADLRFLYFVDMFVGLVLLGLIVWWIVWRIGVTKRWERRQEAQTRAMIKIAAAIARSNDPKGDLPGWADTKPGEH